VAGTLVFLIVGALALRIPAKWSGQSGGSGRVVSEQVARVGAKRRWR